MGMSRTLLTAYWAPIYSFIVIVLAAGAGGCQDSVSDRDIQSLPLAEVRRLTEKESGVVLLDSRLPSEFAAGHIPGAVGVPSAGVPSDKAKLPAALASPRYVIVYGANRGDGYAAAITKNLIRAGQKGARLFAGGLEEWQRAGLKVESSGGAAPEGAEKR